MFDPQPRGIQVRDHVARISHNIGVPIYVRWYWPDEDIWVHDELDTDRYSLRHVEVRGADGRVVAAASLAEALAARDTGNIDAVRDYENRYGVVPEHDVADIGGELGVEEITAEEFEALWQQGRRTLGG
jgi:hypothetical protein